MQTQGFIVSAIIAALVIYTLIVATNPKTVPWWRCWDPRSGFVGGLVLALLLCVSYAAGLATAQGWFG
jgi:hypothetical protein